MLAIFCATGCTPASAAPLPLRGADVSFIEQYEAAGFAFKEEGTAKDLLDILGDHGINSVRLRIWHSPGGGNNTTAETLSTAQRIKARGMHFLLDFHYSDWWADPGQQVKPAAWDNLDFAGLEDAVYVYTKGVVTALNDQGTLPDMIQLGNEITPGMLWDDGRVGGSYDTGQQWNRLGLLLTSASNGVRDSLRPGQHVEIMIHTDRGGDNAGSRWFYDRLLATGFEFDVIGLSYYPFWHGTLLDLEANLDDLAGRYDKDIVVVETAYAWTLDWNDDQSNFVGSQSQLLPEFPATVSGQRDYLARLIGIVEGVPGGHGRGVYYWAPEYVAIPTIPTPYENLTLFDFDGNVLDSMNAFSPPGSSGTLSIY